MRPAAGVALALLLLAALPLAGSAYVIDMTTEVLIYALFALSLNVLLGYAGSVSFGHAAFFALGGYVCAILLKTHGWPLAAALAAAVLASALAAAVIGYFCVRLNEIYFAMLTLAFSMLLWSVAFKWRGVTGGDDGFVGLRLPALLAGRERVYWFVLAVAALATAALWRICHSSFGRALVAIRENPARAAFIGIDVRRMRLLAFIVAGSFAGVAGALFALYKRGMHPDAAFWTESAQVLIMALLGGTHVFFGPAIGAAVLHTLQVVAGQVTLYWPLVLGCVLLVIVLAAPEGLAGLALRFKRTRAP
jgi:branched-chain amino acid transport system permease protein